MNLQNIQKKSMIIFSLVLMAAAVACNPIGESSDADVIVQPVEDVAVSPEAAPLHAALQPASAEELTEIEVEGLLFMREEEKLAGDVYRYFYDLWGSAIFQNIAASEDMRTESVLALLNQYGIADPAASEAGVFTNTDLQALYDQLTAQGSQSLKDALLVGVAIEEIDILDLEKYIAGTDKEDISFVYQNLLKGSESHLRAFVRVLSNQVGEVYVPQYLPQERYDEIMQGMNGAGGNGYGQNGQGNGQGSGKDGDS